MAVAYHLLIWAQRYFRVFKFDQDILGDVVYTMGSSQTIHESAWLEGIEKACYFTLTRGITGDFEFSSCMLDGVEYTKVCHDGFSQWIYLISPAIFQSALEGTRWAESGLGFVNRGHASTGEGYFTWNISVNYLVCSCCAAGISIWPKKFQLVFSI
jgi:hypothetical protein